MRFDRVGSDPIGAWLDDPSQSCPPDQSNHVANLWKEVSRMSSPSVSARPLATIIVGVDTRKHVHAAVAIDLLGARHATCRAAADRAGYAELMTWARALGTIEAFGIEGTG